MNTELARNSKQYVGIYNGNLVCHTGVIQAPLRKGFKQVHRLVVLPDYQGVGIGIRFISFIANMYSNMNFKMKLITTTPAIRISLMKNIQWELMRSGYVKKCGNTPYMSHWVNSESSNRYTYTFVYKNNKCSNCGNCFEHGYFVDEYKFCSDECLNAYYSNEEYLNNAEINKAEYR